MPPHDFQHNRRLVRHDADFTERVLDSYPEYSHVPGMHHLTTRLMSNRDRRSGYGDSRLKQKRSQENKGE